MPGRVLVPRVRLEDRVRVGRPRLDRTPLAVEDVLAGVDELARALHAALVDRVAGHRLGLPRRPVAYAAATGTAAAAVSMSSTTWSGCEIIGTWLEATSTVVAPMRWANWRSPSGGIASSFSATMYQVGSDFHAGAPIFWASAPVCTGCWTACMTLA